MFGPHKEYTLHGHHSGPSGFTVFLNRRDICLHITLESHDFHESPKALERFLYFSREQEGTDLPAFHHYLDEISSFYQSAFESLAPRADHVGKLTLEDLICTRWFSTRLEYRDESPLPGPVTHLKNLEVAHESLAPTRSNWPFPYFQRSEVEVPYTDPATVFDITPEKVYVHGRQYLWKKAWNPEGDRRTVEAYSKHQASGALKDLRVLHLHGIVVNRYRLFCGFLYQWMEVRKPLSSIGPLEEASEHTRYKWAWQVRDTVESLHRLGVVWGSVNVSNVLINEADDAILVGLEGNTTEMWVAKDKQTTYEGDLLGLRQMDEYILDDRFDIKPGQ